MPEYVVLYSQHQHPLFCVWRSPTVNAPILTTTRKAHPWQVCFLWPLPPSRMEPPAYKGSPFLASKTRMGIESSMLPAAWTVTSLRLSYDDLSSKTLLPPAALYEAPPPRWSSTTTGKNLRE